MPDTIPSRQPKWQSSYFLTIRILQCILSIATVVATHDLMNLNPRVPSICTFTIACLTAKHLVYDVYKHYSGVPSRPGKIVLDESVLLTMWTGAIIAGYLRFGCGGDFEEGCGRGSRVVVLEALSLLPTMAMASLVYLYPPARLEAWEEIEMHVATARKFGI